MTIRRIGQHSIQSAISGRKANWRGLSQGQKQWLEIGMLLAQDPKLLLVDEPVAGMTDAETVETAKLLKEIAETRSVVVVEHDMSFVRELGTRVTCLAEGSVLAEGSLDQVSQNPVVIERYLGTMILRLAKLVTPAQAAPPHPTFGTFSHEGRRRQLRISPRGTPA